LLEGLADGGGVVSLPARMAGQPIDWPPKVPEQAAWLTAFVDLSDAQSAHAWKLTRPAWRRLVSHLDEQVARDYEE